MSPIKIFVDETYSHFNTFRINCAIYGDNHIANQFHSEIKNYIYRSDKSSESFSYFHAKNLGNNNWNRNSPHYDFIIQKYLEYNSKYMFNCFLYLESKDSYNKNTLVFKNALKKALHSETSLSDIMKHVSEKDKEVIYNRSEKIYFYLLHRQKMGTVNQEFIYHPDASGKSIQYLNKYITLEGDKNISKGIGMLYRFYEIIELIVNTFANNSDKFGITNEFSQKLIKFHPFNDRESYSLQLADIFSNYFFNYIRYCLNYEVSKSKLKSIQLEKYIDLSEIKYQIINSFYLNSDNILCCVNPNLKVIIKV